MVKRIEKSMRIVSTVSVFAALLFATGCSDNVGLGDSVDTEAPKIEITYPPANAVIKGSFIFAGTASDDKDVTAVTVYVYKSGEDDPAYTGNATVSSASDGTSWQITLNDYDEANEAYNGWRFSDGNYEIKAVAHDAAGRTSGTTSRSFSIDNTAPVLLLTKPTSVGSNTAKSYGQQVQLEGTFSEMTEGKIDTLTVTFYNADGSVKNESSFESITDMSSSNPLTIAQYYDEDARTSLTGDNLVKWENYKAIYGAYQDYDAGGASETEQSWFSLTAYDEAREYKTVGDSGTGNGNATTTFYRGTTDMLTLSEGKNSAASGFSVSHLRNYLNGTDTTYSANSTAKSAIDSILAAAVSTSRLAADGALSADELSRTQASEGDVYPTFQVNPANNPKFVAGGFAIDESKANGTSYSDAESGAAGYKVYYAGADITLTVTPGLDETNIDTSTVSVYAVPYSVAKDSLASGYDARKVLVWTWNEAIAVSYAAGEALSDTTSAAYAQALALVQADSDTYRYTVTDAEENTDELSVQAALSETEVTLNVPYYLYAEGADIDGISIVSSNTAGYGIWPTATAAAPEITIGTTDADTNTNLADDALLDGAGFAAGLSFSGTVDTDSVPIKSLTYTVTLTNASDGTKTAEITGNPDYSQTGQFPYTYSWNFSFTPSEAMMALLETEGRYALTVRIVAASSASPSGVKETRKLVIDNKAPTVKNLALSNSTAGTATIGGESATVYYINPDYASQKGYTYTLSGSSTDNYELARTAYLIAGVDSTGAAKTVAGTIALTSEWTVAALDLTGFVAQENAADILVTVTATDGAGNVSESETLSLELDAEAPVIASDAIGGTAWNSEAAAVWQKSTALGVEGTVTESGSGVKAVYYQIVSASESATAMTGGIDGNFAATKTGTLYTTTASDGSISFSSTLNGFAVGTNTLRYVLSDNVGNVSDVYERTVSIDTVAPSISEVTQGSFTTTTTGQSAANMAFTFVAQDSESGIVTAASGSTIATVTIGDWTISQSATIYGTLSFTKASDGSVTGTVTLKAALDGESDMTDGKLFPVYATVYDEAGNATTATIGIFSLDRTAPSVSITDASTAYVKDSLTLSVAASDTNGIYATISSDSTETQMENVLLYAVYAESDTGYETPLASGNATLSGSIAQIAIDTSDDTTWADGTAFVVRVVAEDKAGNQTVQLSKTYTVDKNAPDVTLVFGDTSYTWQNSTSLAINGTATDSASGASYVCYKIGDASSYTRLAVTDGACNGSATFETGKTSVMYYAIDAVGNESEPTTVQVQVDVTKPTITPENNVTATISAYSANKTITFTAKDATAEESGLDASTLVVTIGENKITESDQSLGTLTKASAADSDGNTVWTFTLTPSNVALTATSNENALASGSAYNVQAYVYDMAGNVSATKTLYTLMVDTTAPTVKVTQASGTALFTRESVTVTANISDTSTLASLCYNVFSATDTACASPLLSEDVAITLSGTSLSAEEVSPSIDLSALISAGTLTDASSFIVAFKAADTAGNESTFADGVSSAYTVDRTAPTLASGDTIGGKTPAVESDIADGEKTWFSDETLTAAGTLTDSGSGVSALYYQLIPAGASTQTAMTADTYADVGTKVAVSGTSGSASFEANIKGFAVPEDDSSVDYNTLRYVLVDAVGNASDVYTRYIWRDNVKPVFANTSDATKIGKSDTTFNFTCTVTDAASGIDSTAFSVSIGNYLVSAASTTYGTISYTSSTGAVSVNTTAVLAGALEDGKLYSVNLTATDVAGNSETKTISYLKVDNTAPVIKVTQVSGTDVYVNGSKSITASITDTGDIDSVSWDVFAYVENQTDYTSATSLASGNATAGSTTTFTVDFSDSSKFTDGESYIVCVKATDAAENESTYVVNTTAAHDPRSVAYTVDRSGPTLASGDTVGSSAGSSTSATWVNTRAVSVGGTWNDTGIGASMLYYQLNGTNKAGEAADAMTAANYADVYTGVVALTGSDGAYKYSTNIEVTTGTNTLIYVAVDSLGNASAPVTRTIKVDATAPVVSVAGSTITETVSNTASVALPTITVTDGASGIDTTTQSRLPYIIIGNNTIYDGTDDCALTYSATTTTDGADTEGTITVTLSATLLSKLEDAGTYTINAVVYDNAGNYGTTTLGTLNMDTTAPVVTVTKVSGLNAYTSGSTSVSATIKEANTIELIEWAVFAYSADSSSYDSATPLASGRLTGDAANNTAPVISVDFSKPASGTGTYSDGSRYQVCIKATDAAGNASSYSAGLSSVYTVDYTAPVFDASAAGGTAPAVGGQTQPEDEEGWAAAWFKEDSLSVTGSWTEEGSGIEKIYYQLIPAGETATAMTNTNYADSGVASGFFSSTDKGSYENFSTSISGFAAESGNTLRLVAVDNVGNASAVEEFTVNIDQNAPAVEPATSGSSESGYDYSLEGTTTAGGPTPDAKSLYFVTSDGANESGVESIVVKVSSYSLTLSGISAASGNLVSVSSVESSTAESSISYDKTTVSVSLSSTLLSQLSSGYYPVSVTVTDKAGMSTTESIRTLAVDKTAPTVKISSPISGSVNKTITVTGTASDTAGVKSVTVWAATALNVASTDSSAVGLATATLSDDGSWSATLDTTALDNSTGTKTAYIYAIAIDSVGNTSSPSQPATGETSGSIATVTVNQSADRPVVKVTNLTSDSSGYVLKYGDNAQISGSLSDDDASSSAVVETFIASSTALTVAEDGSVSGQTGTTSFDQTSGEWSFTPADTDDGTKTVYFYVKDNAGGVFYTGAGTGEAASLSRPYFQFKTDAAVDNDSAVSYRSDSKGPVVSAAKVIPYDSQENDSTSSLPSTSSNGVVTYADSVGITLIMGGSLRQKARFVMTASDENDIVGMSLELSATDTSSFTTVTKSVSYSEDGTELVYDSDSGSYIWTTAQDDLIDFASAFTGSGQSGSGSLSLKVTATDGCGLSNSNTFTFMVDNAAPGISVLTPLSTDTLTSVATVIGQSTDTGGSSTVATGYMVPLTSGSYDDDYFASQAALLLSAATAGEDYTGTLSDFAGDNVGTASSWQYAFKSSSSQNLEAYEAYTGSSGSYSFTYRSSIYSGSIAAENEVWTIPLYFMAVDSLGNYSVKTDYTVRHNPHAGIPVTLVSYPNEGDYDSTTDADGSTVTSAYATIGGHIRVTGTVTIEDANESLGAVYLQVGKVTYDADGTTVKSVDWSYNESGSAYSADTVDDDSLTLHDATAAASALGKSLSFISSTTGAYSSAEDFWGLQATVKSNAWNITLNSGDGLNVTDGTNYIAIRACAFNGSGKMGAWAGPYYVHVDNDVPKMSVSLQQISGALTDYSTATAVQTLPEASAEKTYTSDMYLRDPQSDWYLVVDFTDKSGINMSTVSVSGSSSGKYVYPYAAAADNKFNCKVYIPIVTTSSSVSYTVEAYDNDTQAKRGQASYSLNIDNDAPALTDLTDSSGNVLNKSMLRNSNYMVTVKSTADESGSGFYGAAYYFKRTVDDTTTIELPVPNYTSSGTTTTVTPAESALVKTLAASPVSLSESDSVSGSVAASGESGDTSGLYGVWLTGGTLNSDSSSGSSFTHDLVSDYYAAGLIRKSGFVRMAGSWYQIDSIDGDTVTLDNTVADGYSSAFFAMAFVVDNSSKEGSSWSSGTQTITSDDGDGIVETLEAQGATYTWTSSFISDELDDGPVTLQCAVLDKAGNVSTKTAEVMIANHTPRLTKLFLATDLNGDGSYGSNEFYTGSVHVSGGSAQSYQDALKNDGTNPATAIVTVGEQGDWADSTGSEALTDSYFRITADTLVSMEFVGSSFNVGYGDGEGNGSLYPYLSVGSAAITAPDSEASHQLTNGSSALTLASLSEESSIGLAAAKSGRGFALPKATLYDSSTGAISTYGAYTESTAATKTLQYLSLTLWDETAGTSAGSPSVVDETATAASSSRTYYTSFGSQYTVVNIPVYFDYVDDKAPTVVVNPFYWAGASDNSIYAGSSANGHIELEDDLPSLFAADGSGEYDRDPKVSGKVTFTGTAYDDNVLKSLAFTFGDFGTVTMANYDANNSDYTANSGWSALSGNSGATIADGGTYEWEIKVDASGSEKTAGHYDDSYYQGQQGHKVYWTISVNTALLQDVAATDISLTVTASDGTNSSSSATESSPDTSSGYLVTDGTTHVPSYQLDVVPYINGITTSNRNKSGLKDNNIRSASGRYSIMYAASTTATSYAADFITVSGFNLNPSAVRVVDSTTAATASVSATSGVAVSYSGAASPYTSFSASNVITQSGYLEVFTKGVRSLNNINANDAHDAAGSGSAIGSAVADYANYYNREPDYYTTKNVQLTDDRYLLLWDMKDTGVKNGYYPVMIMNGDNPVFGYVNNSGCSVTSAAGTAAGTGAGTYRPTLAHAQRAEFNGSTAAEVYTEYLVKQLSTDQMAMAVDEDGRYIQATLYNYDGECMTLYYDRYNEIQTPNYGYGWGGQTVYSDYGNNRNRAYSTGNNAITIDSLNYDDLLLGRYQYPKLIFTGTSKTGTGKVFMSYYDDGTGNIFFRNFQIGSSVSGTALDSQGSDSSGTKYAQKHNMTENTGLSDTYTTGRTSVTTDGSKYYAMGISNDHAVIVWYSNTDSCLKMRYSTDTVDGSSPDTAVSWSDAVSISSLYVGMYVSMDVDSSGGLHIAAFDANDSDLKYIYLSSYTADPVEMTVDQAYAVGNWTSIKIDSSNKPVIAYYNATETGGRDAIKLAVAGATAGSNTAGVDGSGYTTGTWEYMTVPAITPPQGGSSMFQQVCLDFDSSGNPVVGYLGTNLEFGKQLSE